MLQAVPRLLPWRRFLVRTSLDIAPQGLSDMMFHEKGKMQSGCGLCGFQAYSTSDLSFAYENTFRSRA